MPYLKIDDPGKRDLIIKDYLKTRKNIQDRNLADKIGEIELQSDLSKFFKPITGSQKTATEEVVKGLKPIESGIEGLLEKFKLPNHPGIELGISKQGEITMGDDEQKYITIGPLAFGYLTRYGEREEEPDKIYGLYSKNKKFCIGDKEVNINNDNLKINNKTYKGTEGLWELLTSKNLDEEKISQVDKNNYHEILLISNTLYRNNDPNQTNPKSSSGNKWKIYGRPAWIIQKKEDKKRRKKVTGTGTIIIPSDPFALIKRLELLLMSKESGNTGVRNEIVSICDELKRKGILNAENYKFLMTLL